jgi:peroxiredoxin
MPTSTPVVLPAMSLSNAAGTSVRIDQVLRADLTVMFFLRAANCPVCIGLARMVASARADGRIHTDVLLVTPGGAAEAAAVERKLRNRTAESRLPQGVQVLASGDAHALIALPKTLLLQHSGTFLVNDARRILYARTAAMPPGSYDEAELLHALARNGATT